MSLHNFLLFHLRSHIKNSCFVFHQEFQTVFGTPDQETLALVFDILQQGHPAEQFFFVFIVLPHVKTDKAMFIQ